MPKVLVVDDNAEDLELYAEFLSLRGYEVVRAVVDGEAAVGVALKERPDFILVDIMMPKLDGLSVVAALRGHPATARTPIATISAHVGEDARAAALDAGADLALEKPFAPDELEAAIKVFLMHGKHPRDRPGTAGR